jgi:hypothetical protein
LDGGLLLGRVPWGLSAGKEPAERSEGEGLELERARGFFGVGAVFLKISLEKNMQNINDLGSVFGVRRG